ncbi:polyphenol oxidase family protein [bacterium]|nr:polyphenol oxidase family protein [bacterium]
MTILRSALLAREGFGHGFGTSRSIPGDFPVDIHILMQVHGERIVCLTGQTIRVQSAECRVQSENLQEEPGARSQEPGENFIMRNRPDESGIRNQESGITGNNFDIKIAKLPAVPFRFDEGDALVSDMPGVAMGIRTADCLPLLIADRIKGTAAAVHCGWRSLALGLAGKAVKVMTGIMGSCEDHLVAGIGPSIGPCCYEVGEDVREAFSHFKSQKGLFEEREQRTHLDLASGVKTQLIMEGMTPENIDEIVGCTSCNPDLFWSWRARKDEGRMVSFITVRGGYE